MYPLRLFTYLLVVVLTSLVGSFLLRTANSENNFPAKVGEFKYSQVPAPSVTFPEKIFPEVEFPEIACPQIRVQKNKYLTIFTLPADFLFDSGKDTIRPQAEKALRQVSRAITHRYPDTWLQILGHTDSAGDEIDNLHLSERRVTAVQKWLNEKGGIKISLMTKQGYGETQPIAPNTNSDGSDNPLGRKKNRRIEIIVQKSVGG